MALLKQRNKYLSTCLLESIEDENYRFDIQFHKKMKTSLHNNTNPFQ